MSFDRWFYGPLREEAGDGKEGTGDDGKGKGGSSKLKIAGVEYEESDASSAMSLYKALQDPDTGKEIVETLARKAGLLDKEGDIKKKPGETDKAAKTRVAAHLKKKLGKDFDQFSDTVGPALEEIFEEMLAERDSSSSRESAKDKWDGAVDTFNSQYVTTPEIEDLMKEMIEDSPPNMGRKNFDPQRYLARIYKAACQEADQEPKEKQASNKKGSSPRGRNSDGDDSGIVVRDAPKNLTIDDAVEAAMKGIRFRR